MPAGMPASTTLLQFLLMLVAGWLHRQQAAVIEYAARAAIFPALVPGFATLMGWPLLGHIPTLTEAIGLTLAIVGLLVTVTHGVPPDSRNSQT
jgi:threonine/homoserine efflux transporter RhtA